MTRTVLKKVLLPLALRFSSRYASGGRCGPACGCAGQRGSRYIRTPRQPPAAAARGDAAPGARQPPAAAARGDAAPGARPAAASGGRCAGHRGAGWAARGSLRRPLRGATRRRVRGPWKPPAAAARGNAAPGARPAAASGGRCAGQRSAGAEAKAQHSVRGGPSDAARGVRPGWRTLQRAAKPAAPMQQPMCGPWQPPAAAARGNAAPVRDPWKPPAAAARGTAAPGVRPSKPPAAAARGNVAPVARSVEASGGRCAGNAAAMRGPGRPPARFRAALNTKWCSLFDTDNAFVFCRAWDRHSCELFADPQNYCVQVQVQLEKWRRHEFRQSRAVRPIPRLARRPRRPPWDERLRSRTLRHRDVIETIKVKITSMIRLQ